MPADNERESHRKRLREKFLSSGLTSFHDYEIMELLLTLGSPRKDCKPQAKEAIKRFKTLRGVLEASAEDLQQIDGIGAHSVFGIRLVQEVARRFLKDRIIEQPVYASSQEIFDYLYHSIRDLKKELFKVIYLNGQNRIIDTSDLAEGTVYSGVVFPRQVAESAIRHNAVGLILMHNHASGNPEPSKSDRDLTRDLVYAGTIMHIRVLDHIIIGDNRYCSLWEGFIEEYEMDFVKLRVRGTAEAKRDRYRAGEAL